MKDIFRECSKGGIPEKEKISTAEGIATVAGADANSSLELISERKEDGNSHKEESGEMENNIQQVSKEEDLPPRQTNYLKTESKKAGKCLYR